MKDEVIDVYLPHMREKFARWTPKQRFLAWWTPKHGDCFGGPSEDGAVHFSSRGGLVVVGPFVGDGVHFSNRGGLGGVGPFVGDGLSWVDKIIDLQFSTYCI